MARTLQQIKDDFVARLTGKELSPAFIERTTDFENFCKAIGEVLAPYELQVEQFLDLYNDATLLKYFLEHRGLYLRGDENLTELRTIANNLVAILKCRGTKLHAKELDRLFNNPNDGDVIQDVYNQFHIGWTIGRTSPCWRPSTDAVNLSSLCNDELYAIYSANNSDKTDEEVEDILRSKFMPQHLNSFWVKKLYSSEFSANNSYYENTNAKYIADDYIYVRLVFRNLDLHSAQTEGYLISQYDFGSSKGFYVKIDATNLIIKVANLAAINYARTNILGNGEWNYFDLYINKAGRKNYSDGSIVFINAFLNGVQIVKDVANNSFDLKATGNALRLGRTVSNAPSAKFGLKYFSFQNDETVEKFIFNFNRTDLNSYLRLVNKNYENTNLRLTASNITSEVLVNGIKYPCVEFTGTDSEGKGGYLEVKDSSELDFDTSTDVVHFDLLVRFNYADLTEAGNPIFYRVLDDTVDLNDPTNTGFILYDTTSNELIFEIVEAGKTLTSVTIEDFFGASEEYLNIWRRISVWIADGVVYLSVDSKIPVTENLVDDYNINLSEKLFVCKTGLGMGNAANIIKQKIMKFYCNIRGAAKIDCDFKYGSGNYVIDQSGKDLHMLLKNAANWDTVTSNKDYYFTNIKPPVS